MSGDWHDAWYFSGQSYQETKDTYKKLHESHQVGPKHAWSTLLDGTEDDYLTTSILAPDCKFSIFEVLIEPTWFAQKNDNWNAYTKQVFINVLDDNSVQVSLITDWKSFKCMQDGSSIAAKVHKVLVKSAHGLLPFLAHEKHVAGGCTAVGDHSICREEKEHKGWKTVSAVSQSKDTVSHGMQGSTECSWPSWEITLVPRQVIVTCTRVSYIILEDFEALTQFWPLLWLLRSK